MRIKKKPSSPAAIYIYAYIPGMTLHDTDKSNFPDTHTQTHTEDITKRRVSETTHSSTSLLSQVLNSKRKEQDKESKVRVLTHYSVI